MSTNNINKIYVADSIKVESIGLSSLLFCEGKAISKKLYSIVDNLINLTESAEKDISVFLNNGTAKYYEYKLVLTSGNTTVSGMDVFKNIMPNIIDQNCMIFINGTLISRYDFIIDNGKIVITSPFGTETGSTVIVLLSKELTFLDEVQKSTLLKDNIYQLPIYQYSSDKYIFFKNGELIGKDKIIPIDEYNISINVELGDNDFITYYRLPTETTNYFFSGLPGYLTYGPIDDYNRKIPDIFDTKITFSRAARLAIDDVRKGMIIAEKNGTGQAIIVGNDFETPTVNCIALSKFSKMYYGQDEYYIQVPEAKSILKYVSEYDLQKTLFPELLTSFQRLLLDEAYDSIQRLKNIRNLNKVDSDHITKLIDFLGLKIDITNMTIEEKHGILEELTNFYRKVGTRPSYNFYNIMTENSKIIKLEQLFTPIKNGGTVPAPIYRYITFRTAEELGAQYKKEFRTDVTDYGRVDELANLNDTLRNTSPDYPRSAGILQNTLAKHVSETPRTIYYINQVGESVTEEVEIPLNLYTTNPIAGPNQPTPTYDYGSVEDIEVNSYDYGSVEDELIGSWYTWYEWDRPKNWYPTNHVQLSAEIPPEMNYDEFIEEFKTIFYDIASTVLYIHSIIEIYTFGGNEGPGSGGGAGGGGGSSSGGKNNAGYFAVNANGGPLVVTQEYCFTCDPERQIAPDQENPVEPTPVIPNYSLTYNKQDDIITLTEYIGNESSVITPNEF